MNRRHLLTAMLASALPMPASLGGRKLGLVIGSYNRRWQGQYSSIANPPFRSVLDVMDHVRSLGVASLQIGIEGWTMDFAKQVRQTCESYDMRVEGMVKLPVNDTDTGRFERELRTARDAGATIFRSALGGRRYEVFTCRADFESWKVRSIKSMTLAEPIARRLCVKIGVENHKDWELHELVSALDTVSSEYIGACIDTGNSIALLEDPMKVIEALAPYAVTAHLKDIAVRECVGGFQMSEVPLGQGRLDLPAIIAILLSEKPDLQLHLEMITRDPLEIPCLRAPYWESFPEKSGADLARTLTWVHEREADKRQRIAGLSNEAILNLEESNIQNSLAFAGANLGFDPPKVQKAKGKDEH